MFRSLRLRLIGYSIGVLALVLLAVGALVFTLLTRQLDAAVETQLRAKLPTLLSTTVSLGATPPLPFDPTGSLGPSYFIVAGLPPAGTPSPAGEGVSAIASTVPQSGSDGVFMSQSWQGRVATMFGTVPAGLPDPDALRTARLGHDDERTVTVGGQRYRLLSRAMPDPLEGPPMLLQAGIPLATRDREERSVLLALAGGGLFGLAMVAAGGLFLTNRALLPLQLAFERQRRFVADASHELRTPLALVRLEAEDLASRLNARAESRPLLHQVDRVSRLVDRLLTLARLDQDVLPVECEPVYLGSLLETTAAAARRLAADGVAVEVAAQQDSWLSADPEHLYQMLLILIDNACRVTPAGGQIVLCGSVEDGMATITVTDSGPGIPAQHLAHIFERFYRVDQARSRTRGGAGLGLAIARELARAQAGELTIASPAAGGVVATIRLPASVAPSAPPSEEVDLLVSS